MSITVTAELVEHVARLSRLSLTSEELAEMHGHFEKVLKFVESLDSLETEGVDPSVFALDVSNVLAPDELRPSLDVADALKNAPSQGDGYFIVPRIIQE